MLRGFGRTRVPRRLRVTLEWGWLPGSLPAPKLSARSAPSLVPPLGLRGLAGEPDQWSAASSPSPAPGRRGQWQHGGRGAPSRGSQPPAPPSRHPGPQRPSSRLVSGLRLPRPGAWGLPSRHGSHQLPGIRDAPTVEGTGSSRSWPVADRPLHPPPPGAQRAPMLLRWKPLEQPPSPHVWHREACINTCQVLPPHAAAAPVGLTSASVKVLCQIPARSV